MKQTINYTTDFKDQFSYDRESDCIAVEISCLENFCAPGDDMRIISAKTGKEVVFTFDSCDWDGSHEDIMGWNYKSVDKAVKTKLLVIND